MMLTTIPAAESPRAARRLSARIWTRLASSTACTESSGEDAGDVGRARIRSANAGAAAIATPLSESSNRRRTWISGPITELGTRRGFETGEVGHEAPIGCPHGLEIHPRRARPKQGALRTAR